MPSQTSAHPVNDNIFSVQESKTQQTFINTHYLILPYLTSRYLSGALPILRLIISITITINTQQPFKHKCIMAIWTFYHLLFFAYCYNAVSIVLINEHDDDDDVNIIQQKY